MHKSQILLYFLLAFIVGVGVGSFITLGPIYSLVIFGIGALGVLLFWGRKWKVVVGGFVVVFFAFGVWRMEVVQLGHGILTEFADKKIEVSIGGYITEEPQINGDQQRLIIRVRRFYIDDLSTSIDEKVLVTTSLYPQYKYGQKIEATGTLNIPDFQDGDFDYKKYLAKDGIFTTMFSSQVETTDFKTSGLESIRLSVFSKIFEIKNLFESSVERSIAEPNASFINGILLGSRSQILQDVKDDFARTSMSHVLAISGYNITIITSIISGFLLMFVARAKAFWFSLLAIILFTIMTGAQAAVVRAAIMGMLVLLAQREGRFYNVQNAIVFAAAIMIYINPSILRHDIGFQLSFAATMGLVFIGPRIEKFFTKVPTFMGLKETLIMSLSAQIMVLPLILHYFKNLSVVSLPANLLVLPTIPYAMLVGFVSGLVGMVLPFLGQFVGYFAWLISTVEIGIVRILAGLPFASVTVEFHWILVVLAYCVIAGYLVYDVRRKQKL